MAGPRDRRSYILFDGTIVDSWALAEIDDAAAGWAYLVSCIEAASRGEGGVFYIEDVLALAGVSARLGEQLVEQGMWHLPGHACRQCPPAPERLAVVHDLCGDDFTLRRPRLRPHIPAEIRRAVMERDDYRCVFCGSTDDLSLDHIYPYSLGGPDTEDNLRVLCQPCNRSKGAQVE